MAQKGKCACHSRSLWAEYLAKALLFKGGVQRRPGKMEFRRVGTPRGTLIRKPTSHLLLNQTGSAYPEARYADLVRRVHPAVTCWGTPRPPARAVPALLTLISL